mgnify:CR=1 FL=1
MWTQCETSMSVQEWPYTHKTVFLCWISTFKRFFGNTNAWKNYNISWCCIQIHHIKHIIIHIGTRLQPPSEYADENCAWPLNFLSMGPWLLSSTDARKVAQNLQWMSELMSIIHNFLQNFHITPEWGLFNLELARASSMCKVESSSGSSLWPCSKMKMNAKRTVV